MSTPLIIDTSTLKAVATCQTQAALRYVHGMTTLDESAPLKAGTAYHRLVECWFKGGTRAKAMQLLADEYEAWATENIDATGPLRRLTWSNVAACCDAWIEEHPVDGFPFRIDPEFVEIGFVYPLTDKCVCGCDDNRHHRDFGSAVYYGECVDCDCSALQSLSFTGRMDALVVAHHDDEYYLVENKSTGRIDAAWTEQWYTDPQLSGYLWAARQHLGRRVVGIFVNAIEFSVLPSDPKMKCKKHGVVYAECGRLHAESRLVGPITRTDEEIEQWAADALKLSAEFRTLLAEYPKRAHLPLLDTRGKWSNSCRWCGFRKFCQIGRPLNMIDSFMKHEPWEPFAYAFGERGPTGHKP